MTDATKPPENRKSREQFLRVLKSRLERCRISLDESVLIVGGSQDDEEILRRAGFHHILNSNLGSANPSRSAQEAEVVEAGPVKPSATQEPRLNHDPTNPDAAARSISLDAEGMDLADDSFELVFAHEVLHHCRSPHRALCEMLRVCRKHVLFMEPNESLAMAVLTNLGFSFPYELFAVADHEGKSGGVRDSPVPNFIYRWNRREVCKTVSAFLPERVVTVDAYPYWDFNATERELDLRTETRVGAITAIFGSSNLLSFLRFAQLLLNWAPPVRGQGNKFFCCIEKLPDLKPWLARERDRIVFRRVCCSGEEFP